MKNINKNWIAASSRQSVTPLNDGVDRKSIIFWLIAGAVYLVLAIVFTWPLVKNLNCAIIGQPDFTDGPFFLWNIWWVKKAILSFHNPFFTDLVYYPADVNLTLHTLTLTTALIALPLLPFFKLITALNIIQLASIVASALGMVALVGYLTRNKYAGLVSGLIFAFCPYLFGHLQAGHFNLTMLWPIPPLVLFFFKTLREKSYLNPVLVGVFLLAVSYLDTQLMAYSAILLLLIFVFELFFNFRKTINLRQVVSYLIVIAIFGLGFALPYLLNLKEFWSHRELWPTYSNGDLAFILGKNPLNPWWGQDKLRMVERAIGSYRENTITLGFMPVVLAVLAFAPIRNLIREKFLCLVIAASGFLLALGPQLQVRGIRFPVDLPFYYLQRQPPFNMGIVPTRFVVLAYFGIAVLAGIFVANMILFFDKKYLRILAYLTVPIISILIGLEYYSGQMQMDPLPVSTVYNMIESDKGSYSVLPVAVGSSDSYFQTLYGKPITGGFLGRRIHDYYLKEYWPYLGIRHLLFPDQLIADKPLAGDENYRQNAYDALRKFEVKYIVVDKTAKNKEFIKAEIYHIENILKLRPLARDDSAILYEFKSPDN